MLVTWEQVHVSSMGRGGKMSYTAAYISEHKIFQLIYQIIRSEKILIITGWILILMHIFTHNSGKLVECTLLNDTGGSCMMPN